MYSFLFALFFISGLNAQTSSSYERDWRTDRQKIKIIPTISWMVSATVRIRIVFARFYRLGKRTTPPMYWL